MPTRSYNTFYPWDKQDDKIWNPWFIETSNLTGLTTWEGITLWPKSNKLFTTNGAMRGIQIEEENPLTEIVSAWAFWDWWEIYNFDATDLTPSYTVSWGRQVRAIVEAWWDVLFAYAEFLGQNQLNLWRSTSLDFTSWITEDYDTSFLTNPDWVPILKSAGFLYFGWAWKIVRYNDTANPLATKEDFSIISGNCQWIGKAWNQLYLYTTQQECVLWNWWATVNSGSNIINFPPRKIYQTADSTYATSKDGSIYRGNGWNFSPLIKYTRSKRLNDNSLYQDKFNFNSLSSVAWQYITSVWDTVYAGCNDWTPWIYIYDNIVRWTAKWFHKAITTIHDWTAIDEVYAIDYDHKADRVYYSYKAGSTYWIDYIGTTSRESTTTWYGITEVFTGWTSFKKKLNVARISVANVDTTNTAKLYYRINDQDWVLLREINLTTEDIYYRENITKEDDWSAFKQFIDIQFKLELTSDNNDNTPPILNELMIDYTIIEA